MRALSAAKVGSKRRWKPIRQALPEALTTFHTARTAEIEIDRLFAEDVFARGGALDEIGVRVGRRADQQRRCCDRRRSGRR